MTTRQQLCLNQMREIYEQFSTDEISWSIKVIRAELIQEDQRNALQQEILAKQAELDKLCNGKR